MSTGQHTRIHEKFLNLFPRGPERNPCIPAQGGLFVPCLENTGLFVTLHLFPGARGQERNVNVTTRQLEK